MKERKIVQEDGWTLLTDDGRKFLDTKRAEAEKLALEQTETNLQREQNSADKTGADQSNIKSGEDTDNKD